MAIMFTNEDKLQTEGQKLTEADPSWLIIQKEKIVYIIHVLIY